MFDSWYEDPLDLNQALALVIVGDLRPVARERRIDESWNAPWAPIIAQSHGIDVGVANGRCFDVAEAWDHDGSNDRHVVAARLLTFLG